MAFTIKDTNLSKANARAESAAPTELLFFCPCLPRVPFRALPSFHPGLCRSVVPTALTSAPSNQSDNTHKHLHPINVNNHTEQQLERQMINRKLDQFAMSPARAILLQSPGRKPWVKCQSTYIEPQRGGTNSEPRG